jgi:2-keto-4-pentenoate hydratase
MVEQRGGNTGGDPRRLLRWMIEHAARRRGGLEAGAMMTTGSYTGMIFVEAGARVEARSRGWGGPKRRSGERRAQLALRVMR